LRLSRISEIFIREGLIEERLKMIYAVATVQPGKAMTVTELAGPERVVAPGSSSTTLAVSRYRSDPTIVAYPGG
jgi:hypothetical protein